MTHRAAVGLIAALACLLTFVFAASAAHAETAYVPQGESGNGVLGDFPRDVAVENATGRVFVADSDEDRVVVFESSQPGAGVLTTFGEGELSSPYGIAIDQGSGDVYVSDAGNNRIVRYTSDAGDPPSYTLDAGYTSPASGSGAEEVGNFASPLAVDPTSGDLLVADTGNLRVERFGDDGGFLDSFDGADSDAGAFTSLLDLGTGPGGAIYVIANSVFTEGGALIEGSVVDKFAGDGTFVETLLPGELGNARAIAYDPRLDNLLIARGGNLFEGPPSITAIHGGQQAGQYPVASSGPLVPPVGIAVPSTPNTPLSVLTTKEPLFAEGSGAVQSVKGVSLEVALSPPSAITGTGAHLSGTVDPHGDGGVAHFEYRRVGSVDWISTTDQPVAGNGAQPVADDINGLLANRDYEVKLTSTVAGFTVTSAPISFTTLAVVPTVVTGAVTGATGDLATLNGSVNPNGSLTTFFFEYGPTAAYGNRIPLVPAPINSGFTSAQLSRTITGLAPGATYHYRIVADNQAGTAEGDDRTFVAGSILSEGRAYEQVTPAVSKKTFISMTQGAIALSDPTALAFTGRPAGEGNESPPYINRLLAVRGDDGWGSPIGLDPPVTIDGSNLWQTTLAISRDSTHAVVVTNTKLTPDATEGTANLYRKDLRTGSYELIVTGGTVATWGESNDGPKPFMEGSDDLSTFFFTFGGLLPETPGFAIYKWSSADGLEVVSRMPDGTIPAISPLAAPGVHVKRTISADLSRVLFGVGDGGLFSGKLFMRVDDETVPVSISEIDGEEKVVVGVGIDEDGRYAFFTTLTQMTADTPLSGEQHIYRYDLETDDLEYIDDLPNAHVFYPWYGVIAISPDGQSVGYFAPGGNNFAIWHDGEVKVLRKDLPFSEPIHMPQFTPNSKYLAFSEAGEKFPGGAARGDVYLYDIEAEQLACASCLSGEPSRSAFLPQGDRAANNRLPRSVTDDGRLFFTSTAALLPEDTNGVEDVYVFKAGQLSLITPGKGSYPAFLMDVSEDGRDVYFGTDESLVTQDTNGERDIYDARIGGGFPSQNTPPPAPCSGEGCQGVAPTPPSAGPIGSESATDAGQRKRSHLHRCKKGRVKVKGKCVKRNGRKAGKTTASRGKTSGAVR